MSFKPGDLVEASYTVEKQLGIILSVPKKITPSSETEYVDIYWLSPIAMRINYTPIKLFRKARKEK